jgi:caa(3)-type oxidase subunit IV
MKAPSHPTSRTRLIATWAALIALMLSSLGLSRLELGGANLVASLAIATLKAALVLAVFMKVGRPPSAVRVAAILALATWLLLAGLAGIDFATREADPAAYQAPRQLPAWP